MRTRSPTRTTENHINSIRRVIATTLTVAAVAALIAVAPPATHATAGPATSTTAPRPPSPVGVLLPEQPIPGPPTTARAAAAAPDIVAQASRAVVHRPTVRHHPTTLVTHRRPGRATAVTTVWIPTTTTGRATTVVTAALAQVGRPYMWGEAGPYGFDCSGLVMYAFARAGVRIPHNADAIGRMGRPIPRTQWQPGTVIAYPGHVALYIGGGLMVEAAHSGVPVRVTTVRPGNGRWLLG